jgi:hypothetical protein
MVPAHTPTRRYTTRPAADPTVPGANGKYPQYPTVAIKTARRVTL